MPNMSYCRFQNTAPDLEDCYDSIYDDSDDLGYDEARARLKIIKLAKEIADAFDDDDLERMEREVKELRELERS